MPDKYKEFIEMIKAIRRADVALLLSIITYLLIYKSLRIMTSADNMIFPAVYVLAAVPASVLFGSIIFGEHSLPKRIGNIVLVSLSVTILGLSLGSLFTLSGQVGSSHLVGFFAGVLSVYSFWLNVSQKNNSHSKPEARQIIANVSLLSMAALTLVASLWFNRFTLNPDGISYLSVAEHYASGYYKDAVNAYWSPMISWLMVPLIWMGVPATFGFRFLLGLAILATLYVQYRIQNILPKGASPSWKRASWIALGVSFLALLTMGAFGPVTPDIFVVLWVMVYVYVLMKSLNQKTISYKLAILIGVFAAVGFYIKGFLLPLFIVSFAVYGLYHWHNNHLWLTVRKITLSYLVLVILLLPWLVVVSHKYDRWMLGSANSYNMSWIGPDSIKHPISKGLMPPSNSHAVSAWEDPTDHPYVKWSPTDSIEDAQYHLVNNTPNTLMSIGWTLFKWSPFAVAVLVSGFLIIWLSPVPRRALLDGRVKFIVTANVLSLIYLLGYAAVHLIGGQRYILSIVFLLIPSLLALTNYVVNVKFMKNHSYGVYYVVWLLALWFIGMNTTAPNIQFALDGPSRSHMIASQVESLRSIIPKGSSVAANLLTESYATAYLLEAQSYGVLPWGSDYSDSAFRDALDIYDVDYFLCVSDGSSNCGFELVEPVWQGVIDRESIMRIYKIE